MTSHLHRDLEALKKQILQLGAMVELAVNNAVQALTSRDIDLAEGVVEKEDAIDEAEVLIEEECLRIMALHQPVAVDLRFIVVVLKVNNDLERMGDLASNLAQRSIFLSEHDPVSPLPDFVEVLPEVIRTMIRDALDALVKMDVELAASVIARDDIVDDINRRMYVEMKKIIENDTSTTRRAISFLSTSRYLERIGDLATNIAEDVIFMVNGEVVRHIESI